MNTNNLVEFTGNYWWTLEKATMIANKVTKSEDLFNNPYFFENLKGQYITAVKGEPEYKDNPEECWAITNKYDPRIVALRGTNAKENK